MDTNTQGHRQWFYFYVKVKGPKTIKFNIFSFKKRFSLFQNGMRPYAKSARDSIDEWHPVGTSIDYIKHDVEYD